MANHEHVATLRADVDEWNRWREEEPDIRPDLTGANLHGANLVMADLSYVLLRGADLTLADLKGADLRWADLRGANLVGAMLHGKKMVPPDEAISTSEIVKALIVIVISAGLVYWLLSAAPTPPSDNYY